MTITWLWFTDAELYALLRKLPPRSRLAKTIRTLLDDPTRPPAAKRRRT